MRRFFFVSLFVVWANACGSQTRPCNASTCTGCCDESGECLAGTGLRECGMGGAACASCAANEVCREQACALFDGVDYDASFPGDPDGNYNFDAGVYDASRPDGGVDAGQDAGRADAGLDAGRPDAGVDAGRPDAGFDAGFDAGRPDAGSDAGTDAGADAGDGG